MATAASSSPAEYNTGFFSSPSDLQAAADLANTTVQSIDGQVAAATSAPSGWSTSWAAFKKLWDNFYSSRFSGQSVTWEWLTSDLEGQLREYEAQIATWGNQAQQYGATVPGGVPQAPSGSLPDWIPSSGTVLAGLGLVLAILVVWKVF